MRREQVGEKTDDEGESREGEWAKGGLVVNVEGRPIGLGGVLKGIGEKQEGDGETRHRSAGTAELEAGGLLMRRVPPPSQGEHLSSAFPCLLFRISP